ncbi:hypothetical protein [Helicobacter valdiviensis]|nr:hypothetical protein [Helicobacter valdiviensis]
MKTFIFVLTFLVLSNLAIAKHFKLEGVIVGSNNEEKTIEVDSLYGERLSIKILPNTEIDMDNCGPFGSDKYGTFKDLKKDTYVEIKVYYPQGMQGDVLPVAKEIEIECHKPKAY